MQYARTLGDEEKTMHVEIIYAAEHHVFREQLELHTVSTVAQALERSALCQAHPEIDWNVNRIGIYGRLVPETTLLRDNDRIEIYRPLKARKSRKQ